MAEKQRVQQKLVLLKRDFENEIDAIKEQFKPITRVVSMFTGGSDSSSNGEDTPRQSLLKMGGNLAVDLLVGPRLAKAGMITRMVVPRLLRGLYNGFINRFKKKK